MNTKHRQQPWTSATWCVDQLRLDEGDLIASGWAIAAEGGRPKDIEFTIDGKRVKKATTGIARPDIERTFPRRPGAAMSGFQIRIPGSRVTTISPQRPLHLGLRVNGRDVADLDTFYPGEQPPIPPAPNRRRVHGAESLDGFLLEGFSAFVKIDRALQAATGRRFGDFPALLDWGVGCGRFARYFNGGTPGQRIVGIDIDDVNVEWCRANLPWIDAQCVDTNPPTLLEPESVDLVIGVSVFTHLREHDQQAWLGELHRITRPGAILALTTHGRATFARSALGDHWFDVWQDIGFMDGGRNPDIDGAVPGDNDYYRNVFTTHDYLQRVWGEMFEIVAFHEGLIGNHQDLNIIRRR